MTRRVGLAVVAAVLVAVAALGPLPSKRSAADGGIQVVASEQVDPRLTDLTVTSPALAKPAGVRILLPAGYAAHRERRYPVLYLLHGGFGNYRDWTVAGDAEQLTAHLGLIVVMPDGGRGGWYSNWDNFGKGGPPAWETFHVDQLIPWVDAHYRTVARRAGRAIAGLSMGGFGAMSYAARHPDLFTWAGSFSGAVDLRNLAVRGLIVISPLIDGGLPGAIFGLPGLDGPDLHAHNPWDLAANLRGMRLVLDTGNGFAGPYDTNPLTVDGQELEVHEMNVALHQRLVALGIPHQWNDYGPGTHSWPYWQRDLREALPDLMATFDRARVHH